MSLSQKPVPTFGRHALAFDRASREALHEISLNEEEEETGRDQREHTRCHHLSEIDREF
ncbi:hypothetical protein D9M69_717430 [compost metagenome]